MSSQLTSVPLLLFCLILVAHTVTSYHWSTRTIDWLSLSGERIKPGMSKRPLSASTSDNVQQPDTTFLSGHNLSALSSHRTPPSSNHHYHSYVKWRTGQANCSLLMSHMWVIHVAARCLLQNVILLVYRVEGKWQFVMLFHQIKICWRGIFMCRAMLAPKCHQSFQNISGGKKHFH